MGKLALYITSGPYTFQNTDTLYQIVKAAIKKGHEVIGIYAQTDGVYNFNSTIDSRDDRNISKMLEEIADLGVKLYVCPVCASFRGITSEDTLIKGATFDGLGAISELILDCDRFISLGI
jgi:tRNA 2-thiouridine synthesizing protein D